MTERDVSMWAVGWTWFAAVMMWLIGAGHAIAGLTALVNDEFYLVGEEYIFQFDVTTWGWIHLIAGVLVFVAGVYLLSGQVWARTIGVILAVLSILANFAWLPPLLAKVNPRTGTPLLATLLVGVVIWALATSFPLVSLAEVTSFTTLVIFALVNAALVRLKRAGGLLPSSFVLPQWIPALGALVSALFALGQLFRFFGL